MLDFKKFLEDVGEVFPNDNTGYLSKVDIKNTESMGKKDGIKLNLKKKFGFNLNKHTRSKYASNNSI